jgi:thiol-disulfide isomerase/thioredoxin
MNHKNTLIVALLLVFFASCNWFGVDGYQINGKLINAEKQAIYLDELTIGSAVTIDTAITSKSGEFKFNGHVREKGIYRIRTVNGTTFFIILDNKKQLNLTADINNPLNYQISGDLESGLLHQFIDSIYTHNTLLNQAEQQYISMQKTGVTDSILTVFRNQEELQATQFMGFVKNYVDTSSYHLIALFASSLLNPEQDFKTLKKLGDRLKKEAPNSNYTKAYLAQHEQYVEDVVGKHFTDIELPDLEAKLIKLSSIKHHYILLDFWASWCKPCRMENPSLVKTYQKYKKLNFTIFSVSIDDEAGKWYDAVKKDHLDWPYHVSELKGWESAVCQTYLVKQIPQNYLIDTNGIIIAKDIHGAALDEKLATLLLPKNTISK